MVQVVIGEQRGEGVRMGCRCFWDADTDSYVSDTFVNVCTRPSCPPLPLDKRPSSIHFFCLSPGLSVPCLRYDACCFCLAGRLVLRGDCVCCLPILAGPIEGEPPTTTLNYHHRIWVLYSSALVSSEGRQLPAPLQHLH
jgi:hypothetical protein